MEESGLYLRPDLNVKVDFDTNFLSQNGLFLLRSVVNFAESASLRFSKKFESTLNLYVSSHSLPESVKDKVITSKLHMPFFSVKHGEDAKMFLESVDHTDIILNDNFLLVFDLPKVLNQWWWKGGDFKENKGVDLSGMVIEWGDFYRRTLPTVWSEKEKYNDKLYGFRMERINRLGQHEKNKFYYLWKISEVPYPSIPQDEPVE
jgi:hypothetical protein